MLKEHLSEFAYSPNLTLRVGQFFRLNGGGPSYLWLDDYGRFVSLDVAVHNRGGLFLLRDVLVQRRDLASTPRTYLDAEHFRGEHHAGRYLLLVGGPPYTLTDLPNYLVAPYKVRAASLQELQPCLMMLPQASPSLVRLSGTRPAKPESAPVSRPRRSA